MSYVEFIKAQGYRVFVRDVVNPTYCFYTDGERIAYAQWNNYSTCVSSVHKPCKSAGTGFNVADKIDADTLAKGLHCFIPGWAYGSVHSDIVKYKSMDAYLASSKWNGGLIEI